MSAGKINEISINSLGKIVAPINNIGNISGGVSIVLGTPYTKFYFPSSGTPSVSPSYSGWSVTSNAVRYNLVTTRSGTSNTERSISIAGSSTNLIGQFVSSALISQTIDAGYVQGQVLTFTNSYTGYLRFSVKICNSSGTITQTIINGATSSTEFSSAWTNRRFMSGSDYTVNFSSFSVNDGDRLVVELGIAPSTSSTSAGIYIGTQYGTDLPQDETTTTRYNPWIQFSNSIYLQT